MYKETIRDHFNCSHVMGYFWTHDQAHNVELPTEGLSISVKLMENLINFFLQGSIIG